MRKLAKNKMKLKYKTQKRERNKKVETTKKDEALSIFKNFFGILLFLGISYLCILGMQKVGLFEKGYTAPTAKEVTIDTDYIAIGTVFNRKDKEYMVLFDDYSTEYTSNAYINTLIEKSETKYYKVDMGANENKKFISKEENNAPKESSDLKINGITLIKFKNGKIEKYISGSENIEKYLKK